MSRPLKQPNRWKRDRLYSSLEEIAEDYDSLGDAVAGIMRKDKPRKSQLFKLTK